MSQPLTRTSSPSAVVPVGGILWAIEGLLFLLFAATGQVDHLVLTLARALLQF